MKYKNYTEQQLIEAVKNSISIAQVIKKLGLIPAGGNYNTINNAIKILKLDTKHFLGKAINKGQKFGHKRHINDYLLNKFKISSYNLKKRLINEKLLQSKCYKCHNTEWNNQPIPLELEHIDGNNQNNNLENLTLLCPNCHAQTSTYRGKNIKK